MKSSKNFIDFISYCITDPAYYQPRSWRYKKFLIRQIVKKRPLFCSYRSKKRFSKPLALAHKKILRLYNIKAICHENLGFAIRFGFDGVHLTSTQIMSIPKVRRSGLICIVSTHTQKEIRLAKRLRADFITFSPIFSTPEKGAPKGTKILRKIYCKFHMPIIALGGILEQKHIKMVKQKGASGFASIRYFV